jgi:hypothetical protein
LLKVENPGQTLQRIEKALSVGLYDCREENTLRAGFVFPYHRKVCHYLAWDRVAGRQPSGYLGQTFAGQTLDRVLYEAAIPVDGQLNPIAAPIEGTRVVFAQNSAGSYLGVERELARPNYACGVGIRFPGKVFDLTACTDVRKCAVAARDTLASALADKMVSAPFNAQQAAAGEIIDGEIKYVHTRKPSGVLGGPFWEDAVYNLDYYQHSCNITAGETDQELYRGLFGHEQSSVAICARLTVYATVSVGNSVTYNDVTPAQLDNYKEAFLNAYRSALLESCSKLHGKMQGLDGCSVGDQP